ncbi:Acyltransferase family protein [Sphingomonas haloaromaticamans]|uniref:Acyltransferase family protein n=1 Tax=Edaphosphingomonas haloaromaticamans TaxID=653954 RepID=A0A1S1HLW8_9SPHN|nr:Acyltransferase family protein [Sphingomonas haloaromaticamans]
MPSSDSGGTVAERLPASLDTVRGLACLLLVCFHVVGDTPARGLGLPAESGWHYASDSLALIRMPVFTILSGLLYGCHRASLRNIEDFAIKKLRRLGIPLLVLTLLMWSGRSLVHGEDVSLPYALTHSYEHLWFLQALLWVFASVALVDCLARPSPVRLAMLVGGAALLSALTHTTSFLSLERAIYLLPFFLYGLLLSQLPAGFLSRRNGIAALVAALAIMAYAQGGLLGIVPRLRPDGIPAFACGAAACTALLALLPRIGALATIGHYSYSIYLWHVFFLAGGRMALRAAGHEDVPMLFLASAFCGLAGPILLHRVAIRHEWSAIALLGIKPARRGLQAA